MQKKKQDGYVGLSMLLVSTAVIGLLFVYLYLTPQNTKPADTVLQPLNKDGSVPSTQYDRYKADIEAAKQVQGMVTTNETTVLATTSPQAQ